MHGRMADRCVIELVRELAKVCDDQTIAAVAGGSSTWPRDYEGNRIDQEVGQQTSRQESEDARCCSTTTRSQRSCAPSVGSLGRHPTP
jgi:hypothetical protein